MLGREHRELHTVIEEAHRGRFGLVFRFLIEVIRREADHHESAGLVLLVRLLQSLELRGEAAMARRVHDQQRFARAERAEVHALGGVQLAVLLVEEGGARLGGGRGRDYRDLRHRRYVQQCGQANECHCGTGFHPRGPRG